MVIYRLQHFLSTRIAPGNLRLILAPFSDNDLRLTSLTGARHTE